MTRPQLQMLLSQAGLHVQLLPGAGGWSTPLSGMGVVLRHTGRHATEGDPHPSLRVERPGASYGARGPGHLLVDRDAAVWLWDRNSEREPSFDGCTNRACEGRFVISVEYSPDSGQYSTGRQKAVAAIVAGTVSAALDCDERGVRGHRETCSLDRPDPFDWDMVAFRDAVRRVLERKDW